MKLIDVTAKFKTDDDCLDYLESLRWPDGEIGCVHCGEIGRISKTVCCNANQSLGTPAVGMAFNLSNSVSTFCQASVSFLVANPLSRSA